MDIEREIVSSRIIDWVNANANDDWGKVLLIEGPRPAFLAAISLLTQSGEYKFSGGDYLSYL